MTLKLNISGKAYKEFYGRNTEQMPKLVADGRVPMSVAQLMQKRLDVKNSDEEVKSFYMDNYFNTGDAVFYHPDGRSKIVLDSQHVRDMSLESPLEAGCLVLTEDVYNDLEGEEFKRGNFGKWLSKEDVKSNPILKVLARDQILLDDYTDYIFAEGKEKFGYNTAMGVYPGSVNGTCGDIPKMGTWLFNRLSQGSSIHGGGAIGAQYGRLLGIASEVLSE